jgi:hypothetical protein
MSEVGFSIEADAGVLEEAHGLAKQLGGEADQPTAASAAAPLHNPLHGTLLRDLMVAYYIFKSAGAAVDFLDHLRKLVGHLKKPVTLVMPGGERIDLNSSDGLDAKSVLRLGSLPD